MLVKHCLHKHCLILMDVINCQLLNVGGRPYRVVGSASAASHPPVHAVAYKGVANPVADDDEEYDEDDVSAFEVQQEGSEYVIRLAYDAEVRTALSLIIRSTDIVTIPSFLREQTDGVSLFLHRRLKSAGIASPDRSEGQQQAQGRASHRSHY